MSKRSSTKGRIVRYKAGELPSPDPAEIQRLLAIRDEDIDLSEIPERDFSQLKRLRAHLISLRVEQEVLDWFKRRGPGYQTRMRRALREYMQSNANGRRFEDRVADAVVARLSKGRGGRRQAPARSARKSRR